MAFTSVHINDLTLMILVNVERKMLLKLVRKLPDVYKVKNGAV